MVSDQMRENGEKNKVHRMRGPPCGTLVLFFVHFLVRHTLNHITNLWHSWIPDLFNSTMSAISLSNVAFSYSGTPVLNNINANIPYGQIYSLLGPSGAGKAFYTLIADLYLKCI